MKNMHNQENMEIPHSGMEMEIPHSGMMRDETSILYIACFQRRNTYCCNYSLLQLFSAAIVLCCNYSLLQLFSAAIVLCCNYSLPQLFSAAEHCEFNSSQLFLQAVRWLKSPTSPDIRKPRWIIYIFKLPRFNIVVDMLTNSSCWWWSVIWPVNPDCCTVTLSKWDRPDVNYFTAQNFSRSGHWPIRRRRRRCYIYKNRVLFPTTSGQQIN